MASQRPKVVLGFLGTQVDYAGRGAERWDRWRPTVDLCRHEDLVVQRLELFVDRRSNALAEQVSADIASVSPETQVVRHALHLADPWDFEEVYGALLDFARSYPFAPEREDYLVHVTTGTHVAQICLFLLVEARYIPGRLVQVGPPKRRDTSAVGTYALIDLDLSRYDKLAARFRRERAEHVHSLKSGIATRNAAFNALVERIERVALASDAPVLLMGPTGAGKSQLARRIYELRKERRALGGAFVEVNCATLRGETATSALFGHRKGAFTGAASDRPGLLRAADNGLLFLDEIGELGLDEQAMLLRALEEGRFLPVGADVEVSSRFQLIAGTNRDLRAAVREGRFRDDLLARIDLWTFRLPGLAQRTEDLEPNLDYELEQWERRRGERVSFNREARERFLRFAVSSEALWLGNFRDFNAALTRMATLASGGRIDEALVVEEVARLREAWREATHERPSAAGLAGALSEVLEPAELAALDRFDRVQLADVVSVCRRARSLSDAGRELFAASRARKSSTNDADRLRKYLARFGLDFERVRSRSGAPE
jgi:transcriptional regulatory protein RtcR